MTANKVRLLLGVSQAQHTEGLEKLGTPDESAVLLFSVPQPGWDCVWSSENRELVTMSTCALP